MKNKAFSLIEQVLVLIIVGILGVVMLNVLRPSDIKTDTLKKLGKSVYIQIEFVTKSILAKNTNNYTFLRLKDDVGEFSIASSDFQTRLIEIYKKNFVAITGKTINATYKALPLTDGVTTLSDIKPETFEGFFVKNGAYFGVKLHGDCTTTVDYIYDPSTPDDRTRTNTCGVIFFDVNEKGAPNMLGIDQYIVALGKFGVK